MDGGLVIEDQALEDAQEIVSVDDAPLSKAQAASESETQRAFDEPETVSHTQPSHEVSRVNDRVLDHLLKKGVVTLEQVQEAKRQTKHVKGKDAAWRHLAEVPSPAHVTGCQSSVNRRIRAGSMSPWARLAAKAGR